MSVRSWSILAVLSAATACQGVRSRATIALGYSVRGGRYAAVAGALVGSGPATGRSPRLLVDTADLHETSESMVAWAQRIVRMPAVVGVVGPSSSRIALATAPVYNDAGIPQVVPMATGRMLRAAGPWTFTMAPDDSVEGAFLADHVARVVGARRIILFYENDEFGQGLRESLLREFTSRGVVVLAQVAVLPISDLEPLLAAALGRGRPDALVMATRVAEVGAVAKLAVRRLPGVPVIAADAAADPDRLVQLAGDGLGQIRAVAFWVPDTTDPRQRAFIATTRRLVGREPNADMAMIQDGISLLTAAIEEVGPDRTAIRDWLRSLGRARPAFPGLTGPISFGPGRHHTLAMVRVAPDGRLVREPSR